jgi:rhodanese-related sulfurtransferase
MERMIGSKDLNEQMGSSKELTLLDVRRKSDYDADQVTLPGAVWRDPDKTEEWSKDLPKDRPVVIFCARGGSVSNKVLDQLLSKNITAQYIEGGIEAWKALNNPVISK